jgi:hypothetical protein
MCYQKLIRLVGVCLVLVCASSVLVLAEKPAVPGPPGNPGPPVPESEWVVVDCDNGGNINEALQTPAEQLYVEIQGICEENVVVERENVFLLGTPGDGVEDGIVGPDDPPFTEEPTVQEAIELGVFDIVTLLVKNSRWVYVGQGLQLTAGQNPMGAVRVVDSLVAFEQCNISNSDRWGMIVEDSFVYGEGLEFNGCDSGPCTEWSGGIVVTDGGHLDLVSSALFYGEGWPTWGILVGNDDNIGDLPGGAYVTLRDVTVEAPGPIRVDGDSTFKMEGGKLTTVPAVGWRALRVLKGSTASVSNLVMQGAFYVSDRAKLSLLGVSQQEPGYEGIFHRNDVEFNSVLRLENCFLTGRLRIREQSKADILANDPDEIGNSTLLERPGGRTVLSLESDSLAAVGRWGDSEVRLASDFYVSGGSRLILGGNFVQDLGERMNHVVAGSFLEVNGAANFPGVRLLDYSNGIASPGSSISVTGNLECGHASGFFCHEPHTFFPLPPAPPPHWVGESHCECQPPGPPPPPGP